MTKLEAVMAELKRVHTECATSQVKFMELTRANVQIQLTPFKTLKEEMAPDENQSTKDNSDSGGCETLETPNTFLFPSVLSFITILIRSCFYFRKIYSPSQSRSYFI